MEYKIRIKNEKHGKSILNALFRRGYKWPSGDQEIKYLDKHGFRFDDLRVFFLEDYDSYIKSDYLPCRILTVKHSRMLSDIVPDSPSQERVVRKVLNRGFYIHKEIKTLNDLRGLYIEEKILERKSNEL